jgi:uncharacterized repeat protein (TIGR03803 family)
MKTREVRNVTSGSRNTFGYYFGLAPIKSASCRLIVGLGTAAVFSGVLNAAQTFVTLHSFSQLNNDTNRDGAAPLSGLVLSSNVLYGTTSAGGAGGNGSLFKLNLDGSAFTTFYSFSAFASPSATTNADGSDPEGELVLAGGTVYGTAGFGGSSGLGNGTVFKVGTDGTGFTTLYTFEGDTDVMIDGAYPTSLILVGSRLYGTTTTGGGFGVGTLFAINPDGSDYTNLYNFNSTGDGALPNGLTLVDSTLYGTAVGGGTLQRGTMFSINPDGNEFASLYSFTNSTGSQPHAGLIISGDTFYGTTIAGGNIGDNDSGWGTIFSIKTNGTGYVILHAFSLPSGFTNDQHMYPHSTNSDGASPTAALLLNGTTLYGTTYTGGNAGNGTIFAINTDGTGFTNLYSFSGLDLNTNWDGANPRAGLTISGGKLYGTTEDGGITGNGTVFSLSLGPVNPPQLTIIPAGTNVVLMWTNTVSGISLQSTTNVGLSAVWITNSPTPVVVNGQNTVTNPVSGTQQFFRLSQ